MAYPPIKFLGTSLSPSEQIPVKRLWEPVLPFWKVSARYKNGKKKSESVKCVSYQQKKYTNTFYMVHDSSEIRQLLI